MIPWHIAAALTEVADEVASKLDIPISEPTAVNLERCSDEILRIERGMVFKNVLLESVLELLEKVEDGDSTEVLRIIEEEVDKDDAKEERGYEVEIQRERERGEIVRAVKEFMVSALCPSFLCILNASTSTTTSPNPAPGSACHSPTLLSTLSYRSEDRSALLTIKLLFSSLNAILAAKRTPFLALVLPLISDFCLRLASG